MTRMLYTPVCDLLGCSVPVVSAGMGGVSRSELVAAVSDAGGFGFLGMVREDPELIAAEVEKLRKGGYRRFGVNIIPAATPAALLEHQVATCIELAVPVIGMFWELDPYLIARFRDAGCLVVYQVGSAEEAVAAERAGAEVIIAQGREAGGHVRGRIPLRELLPEVAAAVAAPVLAAGGIATGADLVTALALGGQGVALGTALLATEEAFAHQYHKERLVAATSEDTVLTGAFHINWPPDAPVRVIKSDVTDVTRTSHAPARAVIGHDAGRPIYLYSTDSPLRSTTGDLAKMALYSGTGVESVTKIVPARERLRLLLAEAERLLGVAGPAAVDETEPASAVCYAGEMSGAYMGHLDEAQVLLEMQHLTALLYVVLRLALREAGDAAPDGPPFSSAAADYAKWCVILSDQLSIAVGSDGAASRSLYLASHDRQLDVLLTAIRLTLSSILPRAPRGRTSNLLARLRTDLEQKAPVTETEDP